jgi:CheY-like chemotaxis protein
MIRFISALLGHDYNVRSATDGEQGLRYATEHRPDLIISDVMMPVMDGLEMGRELRKSPATSAIPLIYLTARGAPDDRVQGMGSGADNYLAKPFRNEELLASVESLLSRQRHVREAAVLRQDEAIVYMASGIAEALDATVNSLSAARDALAVTPKLAAPVESALVPLLDLSVALTEFTRAGVKVVDTPAVLSDVISRVIATTQARRSASGVEVHVQVQAGVRAAVREDELERVVAAIVGRAVRVTPSGRNVFVSAHADDVGGVSLTITDQGPTLSPTQLERVFFPFNEVSPSGPGGVRAGMALTHAGRLVTARGGALSVEVGTAGGTTVSIRLPMWAEAAP